MKLEELEITLKMPFPAANALVGLLGAMPYQQVSALLPALYAQAQKQYEDFIAEHPEAVQEAAQEEPKG